MNFCEFFNLVSEISYTLMGKILKQNASMGELTFALKKTIIAHVQQIL